MAISLFQIKHSKGNIYGCTFIPETLIKMLDNPKIPPTQLTFGEGKVKGNDDEGLNL